MLSDPRDEFFRHTDHLIHLREVTNRFSEWDEMPFTRSTVEMERWRDHEMASSVYSISAQVQAEVLAPKTVPVRFTRDVEVEGLQVWQRGVPESRIDVLLLALPRALRWRTPAFRIVRAWRKTPTTRRQVTIDEVVTIERENWYPHSGEMLPTDRFGPAVYKEYVRTPE